MKHTEQIMEKEKKTRKKPGLTTWIFISLLLGICMGSIFHYWVPAGYVRDTIFVNGIFYVLGKQPAAGGESCGAGFSMCWENRMFL